jgi:Ca-activated chloride channel family protein
VRLHFRDPADGGVPRVQETVLRTNVTDDPSLVAAHQNPKMQTLLAMREASTLTQLASSQVGRGDFDGADLELARAEKRLREQAKNTRDKSERQRVMKSASQIASTRKKMDKAKRAPAPARAKAGRAAALELNDAAMEADGF